MRRRPARFNGPFRAVFRALNAPEYPAVFRPISALHGSFRDRKKSSTVLKSLESRL